MPSHDENKWWPILLMHICVSQRREVCSERHQYDVQSGLPEMQCGAVITPSKFSTILLKRHPITHPWGWGMGCLLSVQSLIHVQPQSLHYCIQYSALPIYRGLFSLNNSREAPIARPLGRGMGVFRDMLVWTKFTFELSVLCYMVPRYIESL